MKEIQIKEHTNNIVSKANELIKAQAELSSTAHKMLCSVISMINVNDADFQEYALKREEYLKLIGSKSNNDEFLYEQAEQLMQKPFKIDGKLFNWCSMVDFKKMPGYIIFDVHPKLKPYLLQLKERGNFTQYQIVNILALRGDYSPRLYELIIMEWNQYKSYNPNAKSFTFELELEELRENLGIPKSYLYNNIKSRIIEVTKKQLKEKTNIKFTYEEYKLGRKVTRLIIKVEENNKGSNDFLATRRAFVAYIRKIYKPDTNNNTFPTIITTLKGDVKVNLNGEIYIIGDEKKALDSKQADKLWDWLYGLIKDNPKLLK